MTNNTSTRCDEHGDPFPGQEVWWIYVVTFTTIYVVMLGISCTTHGLYRMQRRKCKKLKASLNDTQGKFSKGVRLLLSGDSFLSKILIIVTFACNFMFIVVTLHRTFAPDFVEYCYTIATEPARIVELIIVIELMCFAVVRLLAANHIVWFWLDLFTIIDVLTLPHIFVSLALGVDWLGLRSARFFWLAQLITVFRFTPRIKSQNLLDFASLCIYFLILVSFGAAMIHLLERTGDPWLGYHNAVADQNIFSYGYYILVTITTVGYGDISPLTTFGRAFMSVYIVIGLAFFAAILPLINDVLLHFHTSRTYAKFDRSRVPRHVIVCGHITAFTAQEFLKDFLHPDRGDTNIHVLFLHPTRPEKDLKNVLRSYYTRVQYIAGSVLNGNDLNKSKLLSCSAVFILADKYTNNPLEEDNGNLLRLVSIKNTTTEVPVIIQLLLSTSKEQVRNIEGWNPGSDIAVCLNELKLGLLAQSCLCPGFSTLIANLFYTSDFPALESFEGANAWKEGYIRGASKEIYATHFSPTFTGKRFREVAHLCYNKLGLILLAIESPAPVGQLRKFDVNPSDSEVVIEASVDGCRGYFIGQDVEHVSIVSSFCETCDKNLIIYDNTLDEEVRKLVRKISLRKCNCFLVLKDVVSSSPFRGTQLSDVTNVFTEEPLSHWIVTFSMSEDSKEENLTTRRHTRTPKPIKLEDIVLKSDECLCSLQTLPDLRNHIVVCVFADDQSPLLGLQDIVSPLRSENISKEEIKPIVIVSKSTFLKREWPFIRDFPEVYVVDGCPLRIQNLAAASIESCSVCIITTMLSADSNEPAINDKEVVLCSLSIQKYLKRNATRRVQIIADLRQESNVQFLDFGDEDEPDERIYKAQPFACGEAFSVSMMDSVTSSAFHSPGTLYIVEDLIQCYGTKTSCQIVGVPLDSEEYVGKTFQDLYNLQLDRNNLVLGLYRRLPMQEDTASQRRGVSSVGMAQYKHYVITAPHPRTLLNPSDIGFILVNKS